MKAIWHGIVLAESDETIIVDGNHYFPPESVKMVYFSASPLRTQCFWKGRAHYYDINVGDDTNFASAWHYPKPWILARNIRNYVAFWNGVKVMK